MNLTEMNKEIKKELVVPNHHIVKTNWVPGIDDVLCIESVVIDLPPVIQEALEARDKWWKDKLKPLLKYCREQNGRPDCKNCGLSEELLNTKE